MLNTENIGDKQSVLVFTDEAERNQCQKQYSSIRNQYQCVIAVFTFVFVAYTVLYVMSIIDVQFTITAGRYNTLEDNRTNYVLHEQQDNLHG